MVLYSKEKVGWDFYSLGGCIMGKAWGGCIMGKAWRGGGGGKFISLGGKFIRFGGEVHWFGGEVHRFGRGGGSSSVWGKFIGLGGSSSVWGQVHQFRGEASTARAIFVAMVIKIIVSLHW